MRHIRFANFEFDCQTGELRRDGIIVDLPPQPTRVLDLLLHRSGELVTRDELRKHIWPNTIVEFDQGLNTCIRQIRDVLGEHAAAPRYIETVPRRGYRFIAPLLSKDRDQSKRSARRRRAAMASLAVAGAVGLALLYLVTDVNRPRAETRVAVLPFENLSPLTLSPAFVDGLSEELTVELARYEPADVAVISRTSARRLFEESRSSRQIARELRASHVVHGTVRSHADTIVVTTTLVRADDELAVWSSHFSATALDPMSQMAPLGGRIASAIVGNIAAVHQSGSSRSTTSAAARAAFLEGRYLLAQGQGAAALSKLHEVVRLDPEYGLGFAYLARAQLANGDPAGAATSASRAGVLAPGLPETHASLGDVAVQVEWDWESARDEYRRALALAPGSAELHQRYAFVLALLGRPDESLREGRLALDLDPVSTLVNGDVAWLYFYERRYGEAAEQARATVALDEENAAAWYCLLMALERSGRADSAHSIAAQVAERYGAAPSVVDEIRRGSTAEALDRFWRWDLLEMRRKGLANRFPLDFAAAFARFQQPDSAFSYIDRSVKSRFPFVATLAIDPRFDRLRTDPRFSNVLAGLGLSVRTVDRM